MTIQGDPQGSLEETARKAQDRLAAVDQTGTGAGGAPAGGRRRTSGGERSVRTAAADGGVQALLLGGLVDQLLPAGRGSGQRVQAAGDLVVSFAFAAVDREPPRAPGAAAARAVAAVCLIFARLLGRLGDVLGELLEVLAVQYFGALLGLPSLSYDDRRRRTGPRGRSPRARRRPASCDVTGPDARRPAPVRAPGRSPRHGPAGADSVDRRGLDDGAGSTTAVSSAHGGRGEGHGADRGDTGQGERHREAAERSDGGAHVVVSPRLAGTGWIPVTGTTMRALPQAPATDTARNPQESDSGRHSGERARRGLPELPGPGPPRRADRCGRRRRAAPRAPGRSRAPPVRSPRSRPSPAPARRRPGPGRAASRTRGGSP